MNYPQEIGQQVKDQTMDTVRKTQDAVVEVVAAWSENAGPASDDFTKQFPTIAEVIDANFDFAQRILSNQRDFAHRIIAATTPKSEAPKAKEATLKAVEAATAAKKKSPVRQSTTATTD